MSKKIYGYFRISTREQSIERQIRNIKGIYADATIVEEVFILEIYPCLYLH